MYYRQHCYWSAVTLGKLFNLGTSQFASLMNGDENHFVTIHLNIYIYIKYFAITG